MKRTISLFMCIFLIFGSTLSVSASENGDGVILEKVRSIDPGFLNENDQITETYYTLTSPLGEAVLIDFYSEERPVGYAIEINDIIVEFAQKASPYLLFTEDYGNMRFYYDYANYGFFKNETVICFDLEGQLLLLEAENINNNVSINAVLPGVNPQLQNSYNCIVASLSNVIWYWGAHGYSCLIGGRNFTNVKSDINTHFVNYGQGYANNVVLTIANVYGGYVSPQVAFTGGAVWSTSCSTMINEIDNGYPCMVGFKAGSTYSSSVGHMTMCFGYYYSGASVYIVLADGHNSSSVTKLWTSYNDCTIKVRPYYK